MTSPIGQSIERAGGRERVTGALRYAGDLALPGMLHAKLVRIPCAHARVRGIDAAAARALPGVHLVLSAYDLPKPVARYGPIENDRPIIADGEVKFHGEPVAAVVAETEDAAEAAAEAVRVDYEELPGVFTIADALAPGAPLVQEPSLRPSSAFRETNIYNEWTYAWGDEAVKDAAFVSMQTFRFPMVTHVALEPHVFMAAPDGQGGVTIWSTVQHPFLLQRVVASVLGMPVANVRVIAPDTGGGFGGKGYPKLEPLVALLALKAGRPVRLAMTLADTFFMGRRSSCEVNIRTGFSRDGRLVFNRAEATYLVGAYADITARIVGKAAYLACGPYRIPHVRLVGRAVFSHTVPATAFRGFGAPQYLWALESQMDAAARALGFDRVDIRLRNIPGRGEQLVPGDIPVDGIWKEGLQKAAHAIGWGTPLAPHHGRGIAIGIKSPKPATVSQAIVRLHNDGSASVLAGTTDMGQGARTVFAQLAAHELGLSVERVAVFCGDTAIAPFDSLTASSRSTVFMGNAILDACGKVKERLAAITAEVHGVPASSVEVHDGAVHLAGKALTYRTVIEGFYGPASGDVIAVGEYRQARDQRHALGGTASFWEVIFCAAEIAVDEETGAYTIAKLVTAGDIGKALNPAHVEMQDEGGAMIGLGHTMMEHLELDARGMIINRGVLDYRIPTSMDVPDEVHSLLVENADGPGPFGAKGTGESGVLAVAPAVASAIADATGVVCTELPITPEALWTALQRARGAAGANA
ncbi:xanthine dehydrogenase family protein molybdopterin-binding subunit [bacterium]|nr:xanthine dehydrogenase family protein molybdopterin-binding subunit [bacterium]